jgi:hypothetical protein
VGINSAGVTFLSGAQRSGVDFSKTITLGRQSFFAEVAPLQRVLSSRNFTLDAHQFRRGNPFADEFFRLLGAKELLSIDYSAYEQATLIHDMNQPIPDDWKETGTVVFDGGTLEHVFNVPQGLKNCMELVAVGGHFLQVNMANNFLGHGFWQFSPELLFRVFSPENGFETIVVLLHEAESDDSWFRVTDPQQVRSRVLLCNCRPTYILTIAKRIARTEIFARPPIQSDYEPVWAGGDVKGPSSPEGHRFRLSSLIPRPLIRLLKPVLIDQSIAGLGWDQPYYRRLTADAVAGGQFS